MEYFVTNGFNKKMFDADSLEEAVLLMMDYIMGQSDDEEELFELHPFSIVSEKAFFEDLNKANDTEAIDKCMTVKTADVLRCIGREDVAKGIEEFEETLPEDMQALLAEMDGLKVDGE